MNTKCFVIAFLAGVSFGFERDDTEVSTPLPHRRCFEELNTCVIQKISYTRAKELEIGCCKESFVHRKFNETKQKECVAEKIGPEIGDCMLSLDSLCSTVMLSFIAEKLEKFENIENIIRKKVGEPWIEGECKLYSDELEEEEWAMCSINKDEDIEWACDLLREMMKDSPFAKMVCIRDFSECVLENLTERKIQETSVSCCEKSLWDESNFYDLKQECSDRKTEPLLKECLLSMSSLCVKEIVNTFTEDKPTIEALRKQVETIVGVPSETSCYDHYRKSTDLALDMCKKNERQHLILFCDLLRRIYDLPNPKERQDDNYGWQGQKNEDEIYFY